MTRRIKWLIFTFLLNSLFCTVGRAQTINAASCSSADVQTAFNSVVAATTTVNIPAGTCSWATPVSLTVPGASTTLTIKGAGDTGCPSACNGSTTISDNTPHSSGDIGALNINTAGASSSLRMTGLTFTYSSGAHTFHGSVQINGTTHNLQVDHVHFNQLLVVAVFLVGPMNGVFDHNLVDAPAGTTNNGIKIYGNSGGQNGNVEWAAATGFGTSNFIFFEDNIFNNGVPEDCVQGGRFVFRHNTFNWSTVGGGGPQGHATGSQGNDGRGCRATEDYLNTFNGQSANPSYTAEFWDTGPALFWGNTIVGMQHDLRIVNDRADNSTYPETVPPAGWGYCGTHFNGTGSVWDFSAVTTNGHPCLDQVGRGVGQLITGFGAGKKNSITGTQSWPNEALEPVYSWLENWTIPSGGGGNSFYAPFDPSTGAIVNNQDIYFQAGAFNGACSTFTGTCGTGSGLLSARPATCTAGPGGNTNGVAYWGTDTNTLYVCNPTNTWTAYYTPYTYPHPLTQGLTSGSGTPPVAPTNLTAAVQ